MADPSTYRPAPGEIPTSPGVYRFLDGQGRVVYVGKAKNLRQRLSSYFQDLTALHPRTQKMVTTACAVEWTVVSTEVESLALEYSWIKEFNPRFNVMYKDDKSYPYLAVTMGGDLPPGPGGPRCPQTRHPLLRALRPGLVHPRDRRPAAARLPRPLLLRRCLPPRPGIGTPLLTRLHRQVLGAVRGPHQPGGSSGAG